MRSWSADEEALAYNGDLAFAAARVDEARLLGEANSFFWPTVDASRPTVTRGPSTRTATTSSGFHASSATTARR